MKLRTRDVRDAGPLDLEEEIPAEKMSLDAPDHPVLAGPVHLSVHAEALDDEDILLLLRAEARVTMGCARCLEPFEKSLRISTEIHAPFAAEELDAGEEARQGLILALPAKPLCRENCRGLCPSCGKNLNEGPCGCSAERVGTPFEALKNLKLK